MAFQRKGSGGGGMPRPGVTAANYITEDGKGEAVAFAEEVGQAFAITAGMHQHQSVWRHYFHKKGMGWRVKQMNDFLTGKLGSHGIYSVPAEWPWLFDRSVSQEDFRAGGRA